VSRNDGSHEFAITLADHNRNVQKFQRDYFKAGGQEGQVGQEDKKSNR
jgi:hypothetical protein